jgi:hypothetical protein
VQHSQNEDKIPHLIYFWGAEHEKDITYLKLALVYQLRKGLHKKGLPLRRLPKAKDSHRFQDILNIFRT